MSGLLRRRIGWARKSIYFFALHKGGSSVLASMLGRVGMQHRDYALEIYRGARPELVFPDRGCAFGPLRLSSRKGEEGALVERVTQASFLEDKHCVVMVRDPRDILVSAFHSFGFSHGLSDNPQIREQQEADRARIQVTTLDRYVVERAPEWCVAFDRVERVLESARRSTLVSFEEMVDDFDRFARKLARQLPLPPAALRELYARTRPRETEAPSEHKRSGRVGGFREKLEPETIEQLNEILKVPLTRFGYSLN